MFLAACGNGSKNSESKDDKGTKTYTTDDGSKVKIPKNPKRVLVLTANYGNFKKLGVKPVAITNVFPDSKYLDMSKVKKIDPENVEAAAKLKPDLIITYKENKNNKKLAKIALTVPIKVQDMDYKDTHIEIGKLVNKEAKAKKQADKLSEKLAKDGKEIKKAIGKDNTFSIMDIQAKDIYQFGPRFGRGSEAIYEGFKLKEDPEAKQAMPKEKFMKVPKEKFNTYSGDYLLLPTKDGKKPNNDFVKSNTWKNNKAVQNGNVIYYSMDEAIYADLISVEKQAELFKKELLKHK
ncbi:ABC transporter substrate-binding protein [Staphylococcus saprophyticus]|uniref:ABC-type cobalamin Fe3+-siderophores transport system periplasmic component n=3 Tax=Staphylococcus saprophyticus TaxID=29385 RepID=Q4A051_STAS1|nr:MULTISPECIES: ABC transporter substrate-binding protein [Staphylococcus]CRV26946.1 periplasmic binding family protein [Streptococcus equi subsp. equi]MBZ6404295.1 ABC transporter substrate-binding protein [Staphylococcus saprophyticus]MBZ6446478.1 ABC transporter substrate-binding protein [Staphylococcus saprophyticus]MCM3120477.1 ABC transporter substrate-binding protein [Staphylococcus saprophyticus]MDK1673671.1 ABC transporter substrate-binding protein [Staphylococcus saprophyticus]